ncbi:MAG: hypothetical protein JWN41_1286, partial [Thermoleophilia bacterium]|nr:hypothetical protein [Thermoleophilia bacterium]
GFNVSNAGRAHLALIEGGGAADTTGSARDATRTLGAAPIALVAADTTRRAAATGYASTSPEAPRSRHEAGIRAVAQQFDEFHEALLPMVLASGVAGVAAASIVEAIMSNPVLKAQAQRAFDKAREATA